VGVVQSAKGLARGALGRVMHPKYHAISNGEDKPYFFYTRGRCGTRYGGNLAGCMAAESPPPEF